MLLLESCCRGWGCVMSCNEKDGMRMGLGARMGHDGI
jgi:hypothetical protein